MSPAKDLCVAQESEIITGGSCVRRCEEISCSDARGGGTHLLMYNPPENKRNLMAGRRFRVVC